MFHLPYAYTHCIDDERFDDMGGHTGSVRVNGAFPTVVCSGSHVVENVWAVKEISAGLPKRVNSDGWLPKT